MGIENATEIIVHTNLSDISFYLSLISAAVVFVLIWQVHEFKKQTELAYSPLMTLRYSKKFREDRKPEVMIENVGQGTAIDVNLQFKDEDTNDVLYNYRAFAVKKGENRVTRILFTLHPRIKVKGTYKNIRGGELKLDQVYDYERLKEQITQDDD